MHQALLPIALTPAGTTVKQRLWIGGKDVLGKVRWPELALKEPGSAEPGTSELVIKGDLVDFPELRDQAALRMYSYEEDEDLSSGYVISRKPMGGPAELPVISVTAEGPSGLLDAAYIPSEERPAETMRERVSYLWGKYRGQLSPDLSYVQDVGDLLDSETIENVYLREAIEEAVSEADEEADYRVDAYGRLHISVPVSSDMLMGAHRGDINPVDGYPENTLEGIELACQRGADRVEFDPQLSSSGTWWLMHDDTVDRTTNGTGTVVSKSDATMLTLAIDGGWGYNAGRHGTALRVPKLLDVLTMMAGYDSVPNVDIKSTNDPATDAEHAALANYLAAHWPAGREILISCDSVSGAAAVKAAQPTILTIVPDSKTGTPQLYPAIDYWSSTREFITNREVVQSKAPAKVQQFIQLEAPDDYGADEAQWIRDAYTFGVDSILSLNLPAGLLTRDAYRAEIGQAPFVVTADGNSGVGEIAPMDLDAEYETKETASAVYINGMKPSGSGLFMSPYAIEGAPIRVASLDAPNCRTQTKARRLARAYFRRRRSRLRGSFTTTSPNDGWMPGQQLTVRRTSFGIDMLTWIVSVVRTPYINVAGSRWKYAVTFGSERSAW